MALGGLDQGRRQRHSGHARSGADQQRPSVGDAQRPAHVDTAHPRRPTQRPRQLHVPNQHRSHAQSSKSNSFQLLVGKGSKAVGKGNRER